MMLVDCQTCPVREVHCADCMVMALTRLPMPVRAPDQDWVPGEDLPDDRPLDPAERRAVSMFIAAGLISRAEGASLTATVEPVPGVRRPVGARRMAAG
ncbi:MAG: hypothetical protein ABIZ07_02695 [Dermatophilaceae bacterium]